MLPAVTSLGNGYAELFSSDIIVVEAKSQIFPFAPARPSVYQSQHSTTDLIIFNGVPGGVFANSTLPSDRLIVAHGKRACFAGTHASVVVTNRVVDRVPSIATDRILVAALDIVLALPVLEVSVSVLGLTHLDGVGGYV